MSVLEHVRFSFLYIDYYTMGSTWFYPESQVPYNMLRFITKGTANFTIDGDTFSVQKNQIIFIPNGCRLECLATSEQFEFYSIRFIARVAENANLLEKYYHIPRVTEDTGEGRHFREIYKWAKSSHVARKCFVRGNLDLLIGELSVKGIGNKSINEEIKIDSFDVNYLKRREKVTQNVMDYRIRAVCDYIILHPTEKYTPQIMADMATLSKQRFSGLFKKNTGKTPMEYVREVRLTTASRLLLISDKNINDIAYAVGYTDANYFIREFKMAFGSTPSQYRKNAQEG